MFTVSRRQRQHQEVHGQDSPIGQQVGREHLHRLASPEAKHPRSAERAQRIGGARGTIGTSKNCNVERERRGQSNDSCFKQEAEVSVIRNRGGSDEIRVRQRLVSDAQQGVPRVRDQEVQKIAPTRQASRQHGIRRLGKILKHGGHALPVESGEDREGDGKNGRGADSEDRDPRAQASPADSLAMQPEQDIRATPRLMSEARE